MPDGTKDGLAVGKRSLRHRGGCRSPCKETSVFHSSWAHLDSNQGPAGYEPDALTAELWTPISPETGEPRSIALLRRPEMAGDRVIGGVGSARSGGSTGLIVEVPIAVAEQDDAFDVGLGLLE